MLEKECGVQLVPVSPSIAQAAARIRAIYTLPTPDALQIATVLELGATFFVTNDPVFKRVPGISVIVLDEVPHNNSGQTPVS